MPASSPSFIDLFAGAGGLSEGFQQAGWLPIAGSELDPDACATYEKNFPGATMVRGDIRHVRRRLRSLAESADVVAGGPPCQGFSQVRNHARLIDDPKNSLYREFVALVGAAEPRAFVMENVPGMAQMGVLQQVMFDLGLGGRYHVAASLVDAADYGVPQTRKRLIFIGFHRDLGREPPQLSGTGAAAALWLDRDREARDAGGRSPSGSQEVLFSRLADDWDDGIVTVRQAIGDLMQLKPAGYGQDALSVASLPEPTSAFQKAMRQELVDLIQNVAVPRMNADTATRLAAIPPGGNHLDLPDHLTARYLTDERWGQSNGSGRLSRKHFYAYRRLHPDIWCWTLNTKADSVYHWASPRALSVREFARLQSFPDRFVFITDERKGPLEGRLEGGAAHSRYRQVGNAVPPLLARAIAQVVGEALAPLTA